MVQEKFLQREWNDGLFPGLLMRAEAEPQKWDPTWGDEIIRTGSGFIQPDLRPLRPGVDPTPVTYNKEQWSATKQLYGQTIDEHMPSSAAAFASLLMDKAKKMAMAAAQSMNRKARQVLYNAGSSGWTNCDGAQAAVTTLRVARLNGFTKARRPDLAQGSPVRFEAVSTSNPLSITIYDNAGPAAVTRTVTGFTPDNAGDEFGPGTLTIAGGAVTVDDRAYVYASDRTSIVRVGGGNSVDDVGGADVLTFADIRTAVSRFRTQNVPAHSDGRFHSHINPTSQTQLYGDPEFQRMLTGVPDYLPYKAFTLGETLGCIFFMDNEVPQAFNVYPGTQTAFVAEQTSWEAREGLAPELFNANSVAIQRPIFTGFGGMIEYFEDFENQVTEAGLQGAKMSTVATNNGITVVADRTWLMIRSPQNRLQDIVALTWKFAGDFPFRTDATSGDAARFKRVLTIEHGS